MPLITLGNALQKLKLKLPSKGDTNWSEDIKTECFQKIVDHDHSDYAGAQIDTAGLKDLGVTTAKLANDAVTPAKIDVLDDSLAATNTHFLIADGTDYSSFALSGHVTCTNAGVVSLGTGVVTADHIADGTIIESEIADDAIQVEHKKTYEIASLSGSAENVTAIATGEAMKLSYRIKRSSTYQIGSINVHASGASAGYVQDEFIGDDLGVAFTIASNYIQVNGNSGDELIYSIEFKENTTA